MHPFFKSDKMHGNVVFNFRGGAINDLNAFAIGYLPQGSYLPIAWHQLLAIGTMMGIQSSICIGIPLSSTSRR
jgi:hypothetical protein